MKKYVRIISKLSLRIIHVKKHVAINADLLITEDSTKVKLPLLFYQCLTLVYSISISIFIPITLSIRSMRPISSNRCTRYTRCKQKVNFQSNMKTSLHTKFHLQENKYKKYTLPKLRKFVNSKKIKTREEYMVTMFLFLKCL